jgi:hypothetical protein
MKFEPKELDHDRLMQKMWSYRYKRNVDAGGKSETQTKKVINSMDDDLKEAIQRSLADASPASAKREASTADTAVSTLATDVPTVKSADDKNTQEALDNKDPETKEALGRSLEDSCPAPATKDVVSTNDTKMKLETMDGTPSEPKVEKNVDIMDVETKEAIRRSLSDFIAHRPKTNQMKIKENAVDEAMKEAIRRSLSDCLANRLTKPKVGKNVKTMDGETKEAIRRSLNDFILQRMTDNKTETAEPNEVDTPPIAVDIEVNEEVSTIEAPSINLDIEEVGTIEAPSVNLDIEVNEEVSAIETPSVSVNIVIDDDDDLSDGVEEDNDDDLSEGTADDAHVNHVDEDVEATVDDNDEMVADTENTESKISKDDSETADEWQMVTEDEEMIAVAAQMLGSALFHSDASLARKSDHSC